MPSILCPACGARLVEGVLRCRFCGTHTAKAKPAPLPEPVLSFRDAMEDPLLLRLIEAKEKVRRTRAGTPARARAEADVADAKAAMDADDERAKVATRFAQDADERRRRELLVLEYARRIAVASGKGERAIRAAWKLVPAEYQDEVRQRLATPPEFH